MNKKVISALTTALVVGAASTTFAAAANPFSDVPAGHWAYDAVTQLAADGVIEGYGDGTYLGNRNITRYEMAQMIAKAMAKGPKNTTDQAALNKLSQEFSEELNNLGVRVSQLEKYADKVQWHGKVEYTYTSRRNGEGANKVKENDDGYIFRLEPKAEVNNHWTVNARIDASGNMKHDSTTDFELKRAWAEGDYDNFNVKVGKMELYTNENGLIFDDEFSGASLTFGNKLTANVLGGRIDVSDSKRVEEFGRANDPASFIGVNLQYNPDRGLYGGGGYYHLKSDVFALSATDNSDKVDIWSANAGYNFSDKAKLWGAYARADSNGTGLQDWAEYSWQAELDIGNYNDASEKGQWLVYGAYRRYGSLSSLFPTGDGVDWGQKGWEVGLAWAPMKNVGLLAKYFNGENMINGSDAEKLFGRVEFFF